MDARFSLLGYRFGLDSIIGLVPWLGDVAGGVISIYIIWEARKIGVPEKMTNNMIVNVLMDVFIGGVPVLGDIFDLVFKANRRNVAMIEEYLGVSRS